MHSLEAIIIVGEKSSQSKKPIKKTANCYKENGVAEMHRWSYNSELRLPFETD
jgi:hypothetical protein